MSEHITHLAVAEDSARLASLDPNFSRRLLDCIHQFPRALQLGSITRSGDKFIIPLISKWREDWQEHDPRSEKMAYLLGWSGHLAGDRTFKPVYRLTNLSYYIQKLPSPSDASIYHDTTVFDQVYDNGNMGPFHPSLLESDLSSHPAADWVPVRRLERSMSGSLAGVLARSKAFLNADPQNWRSDWSTLDKERQSFYVDVDRYTSAYHNPDPQLQKQLIIDTNFYNPEDPIIQLARGLQNGKTVNTTLDQALEEASEQSLYARAIKLGHQFLMADSDFFEKKINQEEAEERHRRGRKHKEKLDYYIKLAKTNGQ